MVTRIQAGPTAARDHTQIWTPLSTSLTSHVFNSSILHGKPKERPEARAVILYGGRQIIVEL